MTTQPTSPYAALVLRLGLGIMFIAHALLKLLVFTPEGTVGFFSSLGIPGWLAYPTIAIELIGGVMLILGTKTKYISLALIPVLIGTIVLVHGANGWMFANEGGGWEYPLFLIIALIAQSLMGSGTLNSRSIFSKNN